MTAYSPSAIRRFRTLAEDLRRTRDELDRAGDDRRVISASAIVEEAARLLLEVAEQRPGHPAQREHFAASRG